ncbi:hypothetical protein V498_08803 [Pseudogymnoascus sp. VKM F-4517 (FW-2822)]|nr:hypothetical protein V498_08803 [Pseudogymnoascus sp. VKM F-4517 (FW-2822)]
MELLTGQPDYSHYGMNSASAECKGGVCVYLPSLQNPTTSPPEQLRAIVVGGHIEWNCKMFSRVEDGRSERRKGLTNNLASTLAEAYGIATKLEIVVEETFTSDVLEADLWISSTLITTGQLLAYHTNHERYRDDFEPIRSFGASEIRSTILLHRLLTGCYSTSVKIVAGLTSWSGPCSKAVESSWADGYNNKCHIPTSDEWILISEGQCCQEIVRGPYQLLYSVICTVGGSSKIRLSSVVCLICLLSKYRRKNALNPRGYLDNNRNDDLKHVDVHSFLGNMPSSQVLLTSATYPQRSFRIYNTGSDSDSNQESISRALQREQGILPPLYEDDSTTSDCGYESGSSVSSSRSIRHWMPRPERDRESSTPSERPRARSV